MATAIVYGTTTGNTESAAELIAGKLGISDVLNIASTDADTLNGFDKLIVGTSTWGSGDLQDDWEAFDFSALNLAGKTVAVFGVGDSSGYPDTYCGGMGKLAEKFKEAGATLVGAVELDGYENAGDFADSEAIVDGKLVGLALDADNYGDLTEERVDAWIEQIKGDIA